MGSQTAGHNRVTKQQQQHIYIYTCIYVYIYLYFFSFPFPLLAWYSSTNWRQVHAVSVHRFHCSLSVGSTSPYTSFFLCIPLSLWIPEPSEIQIQMVWSYPSTIPQKSAILGFYFSGSWLTPITFYVLFSWCVIGLSCYEFTISVINQTHLPFSLSSEILGTLPTGNNIQWETKD